MTDKLALCRKPTCHQSYTKSPRLLSHSTISSNLAVGKPRGTRLFSYEGIREKGSAGTRSLDMQPCTTQKAVGVGCIGTLPVMSSSFDNRGRTDHRPQFLVVLKLHSLCHLPYAYGIQRCNLSVIFCTCGGKNLHLRRVSGSGELLYLPPQNFHIWSLVCVVTVCDRSLLLL
jgi:hypothetical protein